MIKRIYRFFCSMRFGMILLLLIAVLCIAATAGGAEWIYSSPVFIALFVMLSLNLLLCSIVRIFHLGDQKKALAQKAIRGETTLSVTDPALWMKKHHFRPDGDVFFRRSFGFLGSFFTHLSLLLIMIAAACIFHFSKAEDISLLPEEDVTLSDGTVLHLDDFTLESDAGSTFYQSRITAALPDGSTVQRDIEVNHPARIGRYKVFQQNFAYAAVIGLRTEDAPEEELVWLNEPAFLSLDGETGLYYSQMFGNVVEEDDQVKISYSSEIINPAYEVNLAGAGSNAGHTGLVYPGTELMAGGITFVFHEPQAYPGLRVKTQPEWALILLYVSFALSLLGLYLCFFDIPEAAHIKENGLTIAGRKDISDQIEKYREEPL